MTYNPNHSCRALFLWSLCLFVLQSSLAAAYNLQRLDKGLGIVTSPLSAQHGTGYRRTCISWHKSEKYTCAQPLFWMTWMHDSPFPLFWLVSFVQPETATWQVGLMGFILKRVEKLIYQLKFINQCVTKKRLIGASEMLLHLHAKALGLILPHNEPSFVLAIVFY